MCDQGKGKFEHSLAKAAKVNRAAPATPTPTSPRAEDKAAAPAEADKDK